MAGVIHHSVNSMLLFGAVETGDFEKVAYPRCSTTIGGGTLFITWSWPMQVLAIPIERTAQLRGVLLREPWAPPAGSGAAGELTAAEFHLIQVLVRRFVITHDHRMRLVAADPPLLPSAPSA